MSEKRIIPIGDAPGGKAFIARVVAAASLMSVALASEPTDVVLAKLDRTRENLRRDLAPLLGASAAEQIAKAFTSAVMSEIEAAGSRGLQ